MDVGKLKIIIRALEYARSSGYYDKQVLDEAIEQILASITLVEA